MKLKLLIALLIPLLFISCDSLFDKGDVEKTYDGPAQVEFTPLQQEVSEIAGSTTVNLQLIGQTPTSDVSISVEVDASTTAQAGVHYNLTSTQATIAANSNSVALPIEILDSGIFGQDSEVELVLNIASASGDVQIAENLDQATIFIAEFGRAATLNAQALDLRAGIDDNQVLVSNVTGQPGDSSRIITTNPADGDFEGETIVGYTILAAPQRGGSVLVEVLNSANGAPDASLEDHVAHVIRGSQASQTSLANFTVSAETLGFVAATSSAAPIYGVLQFTWNDETAIDSTNSVTVDVIEIGYTGTVGQDTVSIDLHESDVDGAVGAYVGVSAIDLAVNTVYNLVQIDVVEPVEAGDSEAERTTDYIRGTGFYLSMVHIGPAGLNGDDERIPAQQPPLLSGQLIDNAASFIPISELAEVTIDSVNVLP
ncbi:MAG: Calx-beta domain-containing protein [Gracilimonas sp.]|nr:Calx-beta domain-containing protein [Gracilimonas sp.]